MARQPDSYPDGFWPSCDDQQPAMSIRPLGQADLLAHLHQDHLLRSGGPAPVVAVRVRASVGRPGASAHSEHRRRRATELAIWAHSLPWRVLALVAAGVAAWLAAARVAPNLAASAGITVAAGLAWRLRFRSSPDTVACGVGGRGAAHGPVAGSAGAPRLGGPARPGHPWLDSQPRPPGHRPGGVLAIDSKQYRGQL